MEEEEGKLIRRLNFSRIQVFLKPRCLLNHLTSTCDCFNVLLPTSCKFLFPTHSRRYRLWRITMVERHLFSGRFSGRYLPCLDWVSPVFHLPAPTLAGTGVCMEWALDQWAVPVHRGPTKEQRAVQSFHPLLTFRGRSPHPPRIHLGSSCKQILPAQGSYVGHCPLPLPIPSRYQADPPTFNSQRLLCLSQKKQ